MPPCCKAHRCRASSVLYASLLQGLLPGPCMVWSYWSGLCFIPLASAAHPTRGPNALERRGLWSGLVCVLYTTAFWATQSWLLVSRPARLSKNNPHGASLLPYLVVTWASAIIKHCATRQFAAAFDACCWLVRQFNRFREGSIGGAGGVGAVAPPTEMVGGHCPPNWIVWRSRPFTFLFWGAGEGKGLATLASTTCVTPK